MYLTEHDKNYIEKLKTACNAISWAAELENNTYYITCDRKTQFINKQASWIEMQEQFFNALVNQDNTYQFAFHRKQNGSIDKPFDDIYDAKASPWLVARMLALLDKSTFTLQVLLEDSLYAFNIDVVSECLKQKFDYKHVNKISGKHYYNQFEQVCSLIKEISKQNNTYQEELSSAFIDNIVASNLPNHIPKSYLLSEYNKVFNGVNISKLLKVLNIKTLDSAINQDEEIVLTTFKINYTVALSKNFNVSNIDKLIKHFPYQEISFPKFHLLASNVEHVTIAVENTEPHAKKLVLSLFDLLIENQYSVSEDKKNNFTILNTIVQKIKLNVSIENKETHKSKALKI